MTREQALAKLNLPTTATEEQIAAAVARETSKASARTKVLRPATLLTCAADLNVRQQWAGAVWLSEDCTWNGHGSSKQSDMLSNGNICFGGRVTPTDRYA